MNVCLDFKPHVVEAMSCLCIFTTQAELGTEQVLGKCWLSEWIRKCIKQKWINFKFYSEILHKHTNAGSY